MSGAVFGTELVRHSYFQSGQAADPMELVAGETYLLIAINKEGYVVDFIKVSIL